jgi:hypothetical protein
VITGPYLGSAVDEDADGQPTSAADGDDNDADGDDEDGVTFDTPVVPNVDVDITVVVAAQNCTLNAWIDFNSDGDWDDAGEQIFTDQSLAVGSNALTFSAPSTATGTMPSRFRCSTQTGLTYEGEASDGEVEDYIRPPWATTCGRMRTKTASRIVAKTPWLGSLSSCTTVMVRLWWTATAIR